MGDLFPLLMVMLLIFVPIAVVGKSLIRPVGEDMDDLTRKKQWASRFSLLMLAVPALVAGIFFIRITLYWGPPPRGFWAVADKLWMGTGIAGLVSGIVASHLARWKGNELLLIVIHLLSIFLIGMFWYMSTISWVGV
jgi:hypothetical protein